MVTQMFVGLMVFTPVTAKAALPSFTDRQIAANDRILYFVNCGGFPTIIGDRDNKYIPMSFKLRSNANPANIDYHMFKTGLYQGSGFVE